MKGIFRKVYYRNIKPENSTLFEPAAYHPTSTSTLAGLPQIKNLKPAVYDPADNGTHGSLRTERPPVFENSPATAQLDIQETHEGIDSLYVKGDGSSHILLDSGTLFEGGRQNRVLRKPVIVEQKPVKVPVYCVEAGRWEKTDAAFKPRFDLPDIILYRLNSLNLKNNGGLNSQQFNLWDAIGDYLSLGSIHDEKMNLLDINNSENAATPPPALRHNEGIDGAFAIDPWAGTSAFHLYSEKTGLQAAEYLRSHESRLQRFRHYSASRIFFTVFDEERRIGIKCMPDGSPLKDIKGRVQATTFEDSDLENHFNPALSEPPEPEPGQSITPPFLSFYELYAAALEAKLEFYRTATAGLVIMMLAHPFYNLIGRGLLYNGRLATLSAVARP